MPLPICFIVNFILVPTRKYEKAADYSSVIIGIVHVNNYIVYT